jgi:hypothetical protein
MPARTVRSILVLSLLALVALTAPAAAAPTTTKTVDGEVIFEHGARPTDPGNCSAIVFVQWKDVPGTISATAHYLWREKEYSETRESPFDDHYEWVRTYDAPAGYHRIQVGKGWSDGPNPNDCSESSARQREAFGTEARVELTIQPEGDSKECAAALKDLRERNKRVRTLKGKIKAASTEKAKDKLRAKLAKAKRKRAKAAARVARLC